MYNLDADVDEAFRYARCRESVLENMDDPFWVHQYAIFGKDKNGVEVMAEDALNFEDCIITRADRVIKELYRIAANEH